jgi:hypothetical protein
MRAEGLGVQGRSRSAGENARAVLHLQLLSGPLSPVRSLSFDARLKMVAAAEVTTPGHIRRIHTRAAQNDTLEAPSSKRIKRDDPRHMLYGMFGPSLAVETFLFQHMERAARENEYTSTTTIAADLYKETGELIAGSTLRRWMHELSIHHGKKKLGGLSHPYATVLIRRYTLAYAALLKEERLGRVVLVWMDESYIHAGYCSGAGWYVAKEGAVVQNRVHGTDKGKRIIIIHAMTRDGMLAVRGATPSDNLGERCANAAIVNASLSAEGGDREDYHDTLDGEKFCQWVKNRLLPAFEALYPRKKMCLILDNAKYHHARGLDWVTPATMRKPELGNFLRTAKVPFICIEGKKYNKDKYTADVAAGGPTVAALRTVVSDYIKSHPGINTTLVEQLLHAHQLLFTPPYESWMQPIELVWARVKHAVAVQAMRGRKWQTTVEQTRTALEDVSAELCSNIIAHTETLMSKWMQSADGGSLQRWGSLEQLSRARPQQLAGLPDLCEPSTHQVENGRRRQTEEGKKEN